MKINANTIEDFFTAVPDMESDLRQIDALVMETLPKAKRGLKKMPSITLLAYWPADLPMEAWPSIGLAPQKNNISLYVSGEKEGRLSVSITPIGWEKPITASPASGLRNLQMFPGMNSAS